MDESGAKSAKLIIEVTAGLVPGTPEPEYTKRWAITSDEWHEAEQADAELGGQDADPWLRVNVSLLLLGRAAQADEYARMLRDPNRFNWTRTDWLWL